MRWPGIVDVFGPFLRKTEVFTNDKHWEDLHTRVIEHVRADSVPPLLCSSPHVERTGHRKILYTYYPRAFDDPSRPHPSTGRGYTLSTSRGGHGVGAYRPSGRHRELPQQAECRGRDERLEFGHAEAPRPRGEDVDGGECGTGSAG